MFRSPLLAQVGRKQFVQQGGQQGTRHFYHKARIPTPTLEPLLFLGGRTYSSQK